LTCGGDGFAIEAENRIERAQHPHTSHTPVGSHQALEAHRPLDSRVHRVGGVLRFDLANDARHIYAAARAEAGAAWSAVEARSFSGVVAGTFAAAAAASGAFISFVAGRGKRSDFCRLNPERDWNERCERLNQRIDPRRDYLWRRNASGSRLRPPRHVLEPGLPLTSGVTSAPRPRVNDENGVFRAGRLWIVRSGRPRPMHPSGRKGHENDKRVRRERSDERRSNPLRLPRDHGVMTPVARVRPLAY
jgi:hypothetical protein